jgi:hypothetical protein
MKIIIAQIINSIVHIAGEKRREGRDQTTVYRIKKYQENVWKVVVHPRGTSLV